MTLSWTPAPDGQPISSFTLHVASAVPAGAAIPNLVITAPAGSTVVPTTATFFAVAAPQAAFRHWAG